MNVELLMTYFPKAKVSKDGKTAKVHLDELKTEDIANLYKISEPNHLDGTHGVNINVKRSGYGMTVLIG